MTALRLTDQAVPVAVAFRRAERTMPFVKGQDRDVALVEFVLRWLADPANEGSEALIEGIDRVRARRLLFNDGCTA